MHKDQRQGVDTRVAMLNGLRRREAERVAVSSGTPFAETSADAKPRPTVVAGGPGASPPLPSSPTGHRYWVPGPIRRLALHMRRYFTEQLRHDLYVHNELSTATLIDRLVAENQETRGQLRRMSATLDDLARQSRVTGEAAQRGHGDDWERSVAEGPTHSRDTGASAEWGRPAAIREARDDIAHSAETLRREMAKAVDALHAYGRRDDISEEAREEIRALADQMARLTADQTATLSRLERPLGEGRNQSARVFRQ